MAKKRKLYVREVTREGGVEERIRSEKEENEESRRMEEAGLEKRIRKKQDGKIWSRYRKSNGIWRGERATRMLTAVKETSRRKVESVRKGGE